jgi:RNA recognition motif-containing protein
MKVFVGGLPLDMDDQEFKEIFADYGTVNSATIIQDRETGKSRGFGFVEYLEQSAAENAIAKLNGGELEGRKLTVSVAADRKPGENRGPRHFRGSDRKPTRN